MRTTGKTKKKKGKFRIEAGRLGGQQLLAAEDFARSRQTTGQVDQFNFSERFNLDLLLTTIDTTSVFAENA